MEYDLFQVIGIVLSLVISLAGAWVSIRNARSGRIVAVERHTQEIGGTLMEVIEENKRIKMELAETKFELAQTKLAVKSLRDENLDLMKKLLK